MNGSGRSEQLDSDIPRGKGRWRVDGKFFSDGQDRIHLRGVTYGPFPPGEQNDLYPKRSNVRRDFEQIREMGANVLRCYTVPPAWFFDLAAESDLKLFVDIPWNYQLAFLDDPAYAKEAVDAVKGFAREFSDHPALFASCLANEIPPDIVRWSGADRIGHFLNHLVHELKSVNDSALATVCGFPRTEYLVARDCDFMSFNVYLHEQQAFSNYLGRLQSIAGTRPLVLGEIGFDSLGTSEHEQAEQLDGQLAMARKEAVAGTFVYSFCDEWFKDGRLVEGWAFGLVRADRSHKASFGSVASAYRSELHQYEIKPVLVSVVVAAYNAQDSIAACIESLLALDYPALEIVGVDDGSADETWTQINQFEGIRTVRLSKNLGLSAARNAGIETSSGEIIAFTDADCRADPEWIARLVQTLDEHPFAGVGGHNLIPEEGNAVAAAVGVAPGGPIHVMLNDRVAEHIPGCNMAFYRSVLDEVNGFDPIFRTAGDDVDLCWRIQQSGHLIGFSAGGFVWHDRRSTIGGYLSQQMGYGRAEAMLARKFPSLFNWMGDHTWKGRIYDESAWLFDASRQVIYRGVYGRGLFQLLRYSPSGVWSAFLLSLEFHVIVGGMSFLLGFLSPYFWLVTVAGILSSLALCARIAWRVSIPQVHRSIQTRFTVGLLYFLQPICRSFARYRAQSTFPRAVASEAHSKSARGDRLGFGWAGLWIEVRKEYWSESEGDRVDLISKMHDRMCSLGWSTALDDGYQAFDLSTPAGIWGQIDFLSAEEYFPGNRRQIRARLRYQPSKVTLGVLLAGLMSVLVVVFGEWEMVSEWWILGGVVLMIALVSTLLWRLKRQLRVAEELLDLVADSLGLVGVTRRH